MNSTTDSTIRKRILPAIVVLAVLLFLPGACQPMQADAEPTPAPTPVGTVDPAQPDDEQEVLAGEIAPTRTPMPTATPGFFTREVEEFAERTGIADTTILGLPVTDWLSLVVSVLIVIGGYLLGTWLIQRVLPAAVKRTETKIDDSILADSGSTVRWLVVVLTLQYATSRLTFFGVGLKTLLSDAYFVAGLYLVLRVVWRLLDVVDEYSHERAVQEGREDELSQVRLLMLRVGRVVIVIVGISILLSHFGINVAAFAAALGIGGLAISLAAQDTIADAIAGMIILLDRPFRVGDRIEIQGLGTWGDVMDIGLRTTRIRTRDNRMVIVPNSTLSANQVVNYSYPDPQYRIQTHVGIEYGTDIEYARQVIISAVRHLPEILRDKPVEALYIEMTDSAMLFRVRWWIESFVDTRRVIDRVHTAIQNALDEAGIVSPYPTQRLDVQMGGIPIDPPPGGEPGPALGESQDVRDDDTMAAE